MTTLNREWEFIKTGIDGNTHLFGVNIFDYNWESTGKSVIVEDPIYKQKLNFEIWKVDIDGHEYIFAAGEFSNCIWGFYLKKWQ